jgi:hypothetical protein
MESAINANWVGAVISLPAAAAVIFVVMKFLVFIRDERKASNETIVQIVDRTERSALAHSSALKENTDRLGVMSVSMATAITELSGNCRRAHDRIDQASVDLGRRKEDELQRGG